MQKDLLETITQILDSKKANDIEIIDMRQKDYICNFVVIATAMIGKHSLSLLESIKEELKPKGVTFYRIDEESQDWVIIDLGDIIIHIFTQNHRNKYNLEELLQKNKDYTQYNSCL